MFIFVRFNEDNVKRLNLMKINIVKNRLLVIKNLSLNIFPSALKKNVCVNYSYLDIHEEVRKDEECIARFNRETIYINATRILGN